ncbi:MAG: iron-containing alcohol dehydrogenase [Lachnospiraceae bacterium]|nr:iron-containing alcohol dehydrogenase [Lachnospiraceae bacterium]MDD3617697.1 iron-containing alcohol dehydrogenase [Lachnospiraceae bacterium]
MKFQYHLPVNLVFGKGSVAQIGDIAGNYGKKALIVTGCNSTKKSGLLDRVIGYLKASSIESVVFDKVKQNPLTTTAEEAAAMAKENECEVVVGLGGGSIMDCAKATAFLSVNSGNINDYIFGRQIGTEALPIILVPTTCGTGSEGNGFAVLTNPDTGDKKSLRCNAIVAKASIIDSECIMTMPKSILASVGFDALCHSMEAYISKIGQPMTDMMSLEGMKLIGQYLVPLYKGENSTEAWDAISWASTLGGMVINNAGVTLPHGMEHPASGLKNIVHGKGLASLTPVITEATIASCSLENKEKYAEISRCIGGKDETDCVSKLNELLANLDLSLTLSDLGITEADVNWMAENCMKVSAAGVANHPVEFTQDQIAELYRKAL